MIRFCLYSTYFILSRDNTNVRCFTKAGMFSFVSLWDHPPPRQVPLGESNVNNAT